MNKLRQCLNLFGECHGKNGCTLGSPSLYEFVLIHSFILRETVTQFMQSHVAIISVSQLLQSTCLLQHLRDEDNFVFLLSLVVVVVVSIPIFFVDHKIISNLNKLWSDRQCPPRSFIYASKCVWMLSASGKLDFTQRAIQLDDWNNNSPYLFSHISIWPATDIVSFMPFMNSKRPRRRRTTK